MVIDGRKKARKRGLEDVAAGLADSCFYPAGWDRVGYVVHPDDLLFLVQVGSGFVIAG